MLLTIISKLRRKERIDVFGLNTSYKHCMTNYFFVNPAAGQGKGIDKFIADIKVSAEALSMPYEIYVTKAAGDGENTARRIAGELCGAPARFYACGGDGTLNEIINGSFGFDNIAVGCVPIGTGNDFVRNFSEAGSFLDLQAQLCGTDMQVDLMRYSGVIEGEFQTRYCANMFNIGFDCNVVELAGRLKKKPLISGSIAYLLAVLGMFINKKGIRLHLMDLEDDSVLVDGEVLLCAIANGSFCGGGLRTSPQSVLTDGVFDLNMIRDVSRLKFLKLFPSYMKGTHLGIPGIEEIITVKPCRALKAAPEGRNKERNFFLCADGEIQVVENIEFSVVPKALRFVVPKAAEKAA